MLIESIILCIFINLYFVSNSFSKDFFLKNLFKVNLRVFISDSTYEDKRGSTYMRAIFFSLTRRVTYMSYTVIINSEF